VGTHVFIVNNNTFPIHLRYLFAGTGAYDRKNKTWKDEHIGLLSDIKRVRIGDFAIFYIEGTTKVRGGFYGIFKIADQQPLVFYTPGPAGFQPDLPKHKLIYRTLLEPYEVYPEGIPEWEALDKLPTYATEMQWSLIYRKLKGKRGCTPLLPWEARRLMDAIRNKNSGNSIATTVSTCGLFWNKVNRKIVVTPSRTPYPYPRNFEFNVLASMCDLAERGEEYESYLELYFTENIGINPNLDPIVGKNVTWFGNEVACGVGMQKIDILTINQIENKSEYRIIELKDRPIVESAVRSQALAQLEYYINWASQASGRHLDEAYSRNLQPVIVAPPSPHNSPSWRKAITAIRDFNQKQISLPIKYFEFQIKCGKSIDFQEIQI